MLHLFEIDDANPFTLHFGFFTASFVKHVLLKQFY